MRQTYPNELLHYGIIGMKWGVRRYQNPDGTLTPAGKRRYGTAENLEAGITRKQARAAEASKVAAEKHEAEKQKALASGTADDVMKFQGELTNEELQRALNRIRLETQMKDLAPANVALNRYVDMTKKVSDVISSTTTLYDNVAKVVNSLGGDLPRMDGNHRDNDKKKKDAAFDELLRTKDAKWFEEHASEFTNDQLKQVVDRAGKLKNLKSGLGQKKEPGNKQNDKTNQNAAKSSEQGSSKKTKPTTAAEETKPTTAAKGGIDFKRESASDDSYSRETPYSTTAVSTARTAASIQSGMRFIRDKQAQSVATIERSSTSYQRGSDFVKENWNNELPYGRFKTTSLRDSPGVDVDFNGVVYKRDN